LLPGSFASLAAAASALSGGQPGSSLAPLLPLAGVAGDPIGGTDRANLKVPARRPGWQMPERRL
jgi:hypothetical protein